MYRSRLLLAASLGLAALVPSLGVAHAASSGYRTLTRADYTTMYAPAWTVKDRAGRAIFHDRDAGLFPTVTEFGSPDQNAAVVIGVRRGRDGASQVATIEHAALSDAHTGYRAKGGYQVTTKQIAGHTYIVTSLTYASASDRVNEFVYATSMGGRTYYFFLALDGQASAKDELDAGVIVGATRPR